VGDTVSLPIQTSAADPAVVYSATGLPAGLGIDPSLGVVSGTIDPTQASPGTTAVTVSISDGTLTQSMTFLWTLTAGSGAPVLTNPGDQSNAAGDSVALYLAANDPNSYILAFSATGLPEGLSLDPGTGEIAGTIAPTAASGSPHTVTLVASDGRQAVSQTLAWSVSALSLPTPADQSNVVGDSVSLSVAGTDATGTLAYSAINLPDGLTLNASTALISGTVSSAAVAGSPEAVTLLATDGSNSVSATLAWSVARLALTAPNEQFSAVGSSVSLPLSFTDVGGTPSFSATGLPAGLSLNASTALISGTPSSSDVAGSPYQVTLTASEGSASAAVSLPWAILPEVTLLNPGAQFNASGDSVSLALTGSSALGTLSWSASGLPSGLSLNASLGVISGTLGSGTASSSPYSVTLTASDGSSASSVTLAWAISALVLPAVADQSNLDGDSVSLALGAHYHGTGTLAFSATGLPTGLTLNASSGVIAGTLANDADVNGPYQVTAAVTAGSLTATQTFPWDVEARLSLGSIADQFSVGGDSVSLALSASDASASGTLAFSATGLPTGLSINASLGVISGTISTSAVSGTPLAVTLAVSDGGASVSQTLAWSVAALGLAQPENANAVQGRSFSLALQGRAADGGTLAFSATGLPAGLTLNSSAGVISGTPTTQGEYVVSATLSEGSASVSQVFPLGVLEVGLVNPGTQTNAEGDSVSLVLSGSTAGSGTLAYSCSSLPTGLSLNPSTGVISGTIASGAAANGPFFVTVAVTDGTAVVQQAFAWNVNPFVTLTSLADQSSVEGARSQRLPRRQRLLELGWDVELERQRSARRSEPEREPGCDLRRGVQRGRLARSVRRDADGGQRDLQRQPEPGLDHHSRDGSRCPEPGEHRSAGEPDG
jgi:hypothetical protein